MDETPLEVKRFNRRAFLLTSAGLVRAAVHGCGWAAGAAGLATALPSQGDLLAQARPKTAAANVPLNLAVVGVRSRGNVVATSFAQRKDCRVSYLCDADSRLLATRADALAKVQGRTPRCVQDFRQALDDRSVDAVVITTADHWHCLAAVWACQAGKHVFVAAPLSQNPWEGRVAVEAARTAKRVAMVDLACRSGVHYQRAKQLIADGGLGTIRLCRVIDQKGLSNFAVKPDAQPPEGLNWELWNGPAPGAAYNTNYVNNWQGFWRYSGGDIAFDGVHTLDLARFVLGLDYPLSVTAHGARYDTSGGNETPDTLVATYDFGKLLLEFELTLNTPYMARLSAAVREGDTYPLWPQTASRVEIYGSDGVMYLAPYGAGWQIFGRPRREQPTLIDKAIGKAVDPDHQQNFVDGIRKGAELTADIEEGHRSALLVHYANMSYRTGGQKLKIDAKTEKIVGNEEAMKLFRREYRKPYSL
jgi:predicted dehydrogenase